MLVGYDIFESAKDEIICICRNQAYLRMSLKKSKYFLFQMKTFLSGTKDVCLLGLVAERHVWSAY